MCLFEQTSNNSASISIITRCNGKFYSISTCMQPAATVFLLCKPGICAKDIEMRSRQARREKTENRKLFHAPIDWLLPPLLFPFIFLFIFWVSSCCHFNPVSSSSGVFSKLSCKVYTTCWRIPFIYFLSMPWVNVCDGKMYEKKN